MRFSALLFALPLLTLPWLAAGASAPPLLDGCAIFPADHIWNTPITTLPVHARSAAYVASIGADEGVHPDFGRGLWDGGPIGIPFVVAPASQPLVAIDFTEYGDESDAGPYPIPTAAPIEGGAASDGDRHVLVLHQGDCTLYELYRAFPHADGSWEGESGAIFPLDSYALRPATWTSADAAGLPILPGLVRYDEVVSGEIRHALRFTAPRTQRAFVWPARHFASSNSDPDLPPMGQRFRLRATFPEDDFAPEVQVILRALKRYGMILADNGSAWYISGAPDERWDNDVLRQLRNVTGADFEAVESASLQLHPDSGQVRTQGTALSLYLPLVNKQSVGTIP